MALEDKLVSYWGLNGNANDLYGSNDGFVSGASIITGKYNDAYSLDGIDDNIETGNFLGLASDIDNYGFSISMWIKWTHTNDWSVFWSIWNTSGSCEIRLFLNRAGGGYNSEGDLGIWIDGDNSIGGGTTGKTFNNGNWHHIVFRFPQLPISPSDIELYVDNNLQSLDFFTTNTINTMGYNDFDNSSYIGSDISSNFSEIDIDEIGLFNTQITTQDISDLYNSGSGRFWTGTQWNPVLTEPITDGIKVMKNGSLVTPNDIKIMKNGSLITPNDIKVMKNGSWVNL